MTGFVVIARRWVVKRTSAWLGRCRRLAKDWEASIASADAWTLVAAIRRSTRHIAREMAQNFEPRLSRAAKLHQLSAPAKIPVGTPSASGSDSPLAAGCTNVRSRLFSDSGYQSSGPRFPVRQMKYAVRRQEFPC